MTKLLAQDLLYIENVDLINGLNAKRMRKFIPGPIDISVNDLMEKLGYTLHCSKEKLPCYHRALSPDPFPRFHAYAFEKDLGVVIDVHFDQANQGGKGNHDKEWSYSGGRVDDELRRINKVLSEGPLSKVVGSKNLSIQNKKTDKKSLFDTLL